MSLHHAILYERKKNGQVKCNLCARRCRIKDNAKGFCLVRENQGGTLFTLNYGKVVSACVDPISKKPVSHFNPGSQVMSIAAAGCNFRCQFCDNWMISQNYEAEGKNLQPAEVVKLAKDYDCQGISYTYTEPTVFIEYAKDIAELAHKEGLFNTFVTNGYMTPEAVKTIAPHIDVATVDFKASGDPDFYKNICLVPKVEPIYEALKELKVNNVHLEITNLIIPKIDENMTRLEQMAAWIKDYLGSDTPFHLLRFHPDYKMTTTMATQIETLEKAYMTAKNVGLNYPYIGNAPEHPGENTYCPNCDEPVIKRCSFEITNWNLTNEMRCPVCGQYIPIKGKLYQMKNQYPFSIF
ncbi:MAG: AmmeMemoRadiSam system radical SAM enzyme [Crenarchaeota archaeon]|nr:AmmeMemoRadiSam system radical SAM enzyme [Thermoproteota archaeon]